MADNIFEILIKYGLDSTKAKEAASELKKIEEQTKTTGKEGVKQQKDVKDATEKTTVSKKQLKDMVQGLRNEFPVLGRVAALAINPIAFSVAAITGAFVILKRHTAEMERSMGAITMPEITEEDVTRVERAAISYGKLAENMLAFGTNAKTAQQSLDDLRKDIQADAALRKALGFDDGTAPDRAAAEATGATAAGLQAAGLSRLARAGNVNPDNVGIAKLKAQAETAEAEKRITEQRIADLQRLKELSTGRWQNYDPRKIVGDMQFHARYKGLGSYDEALELERANLAASQGFIDQYGNVSKDRNARAAIRKEGLLDLSTASGMAREAVDIRSGIQTAEAGNLAASAKAVEKVDFTRLGEAILKMSQDFLSMQEAIEARQKAVELRERTQNRKP